MQTGRRLGKPTRFERITIVLVLAATLNWLLESTTGYSIIGGVFIEFFAIVSVLVWLIISARRLLRMMLWRVRNRLLFTYFLFGVVPLVLLVALLAISAPLILGQIAGYLVSHAIDDHAALVSGAVRNVAVAGIENQEAAIASELVRLPQLQVVISGADVSSQPMDGQWESIPEWSEPGFRGLVESPEGYCIAAHERVGEGENAVDAFGYVPVDSELLAAIGSDFATISILDVIGDGDRVVLNSRTSFRSQVNSASLAPLPPARGIWDAQINWGVLRALTRLDGTEAMVVMPVMSRPSLILTRIFSPFGEVSAVFIYAFMGLSGVFLVVEMVALVWSAGLTRTITRSIHDLYEGTQKVDAGSFSHRIPIRSKDQLGALSASFNSMTQHLQLLIAEAREKERLESELEIAREVQAQLFPRGVPTLRTLELAGICKPGRIVSGDYYDFVALDDRWTALAIGDVSGKGISAALLMASIQSAVHAQLTRADEPAAGTPLDRPTPSPATLVARLNRQLYESTSPEKYVTFYCAVYDDQSGRLHYTNAGHLPPILIRDGQAVRLEANGTVVGIFPDSTYEQQTVELKPGDLLVAFTDGITEAENADGEQFGEERLVSILIENADRPLDELVELVIDRVRVWAHDLDNQDDTTMLLARRVATAVSDSPAASGDGSATSGSERESVVPSPRSATQT